MSLAIFGQQVTFFNNPGVMLYILLSGVPPFYGNTDADILDSVRKGVFTFDIPEFQGVSELAKDLIKKMLSKPTVRINSQQVLDQLELSLEGTHS